MRTLADQHRKQGTTKKRVLLVRRAMAYGGSEAVIINLLRGIDYEKAEVYIASPTDLFTDELRRYGGVRARWVALQISCAGRFSTVFRCWLRFFRSVRPYQIVLAQGGFSEFPLPVVLAAFLATHGRVYIAELHPAPKPPARRSRMHFRYLPGVGLWWYRRILPLRARGYLARRILAVSEGVKARLIKDYGYPAEKVRVVYNGVDTSRFSPPSRARKLELRRQMGIPEDALVLVSAARLHQVKRLERLIQAFDTLSEAYQTLWLVFTGEGPLAENLKSAAAAARGAERICFLGHVDDVAEVMRAGDFFVLCSDEEGFGLALAEAMACKLICVSTSTVGPKEIVQDAKNGFLVETSGRGVLLGLQAALSLDPKQRALMGDRARQTVLERFSVVRAVTEGLALLELQGSGATLWSPALDSEPAFSAQEN